MGRLFGIIDIDPVKDPDELGPKGDVVSDRPQDIAEEDETFRVAELGRPNLLLVSAYGDRRAPRGPEVLHPVDFTEWRPHPAAPSDVDDRDRRRARLAGLPAPDRQQTVVTERHARVTIFNPITKTLLGAQRGAGTAVRGEVVISRLLATWAFRGRHTRKTRSRA